MEEESWGEKVGWELVPVCPVVLNVRGVNDKGQKNKIK